MSFQTGLLVVGFCYGMAAPLGQTAEVPSNVLNSQPHSANRGLAAIKPNCSFLWLLRVWVFSCEIAHFMFKVEFVRV